MSKKLLSLFLSLLLCASFCLGCKSNGNGSSDGGSQSEEPITPEQGTVRLVMGASEVTLSLGDTYQWKYAVKNSTESVEFSSNDESVVTVSSDGVMSAVGVGSAVCTAAVGSLRKNCQVTVTSVASYNLRCEDSVVELIAGRKFALNAALFKAREKTAVALKYESQNSAVAEVDSNGVVTAKSIGKCDVVISCEYNEKSYYTTVSVVVKEAIWIDVESEITIDYPSSAVAIDYAVRNLAGEEIECVATLTVQDENIFAVSGNTVSPLACGDTVLTLSYGGISTEVVLHSVLITQKDEYNKFYDIGALKDAESWEFYHYGQKNYLPKPLSLTAQTIAGKTPTRYFLKWTSEYVSNGKSCKYMGLYLPCRLSEESVAALKEEGYNWISFSIFVNPPQKIYISFPWTTNRNTSFAPGATEWKQVYLPISDFLANYQAINSKTKYFCGTSIEDNENIYDVYFTPVSFIK